MHVLYQRFHLIVYSNAILSCYSIIFIHSVLQAPVITTEQRTDKIKGTRGDGLMNAKLR